VAEGQRLTIAVRPSPTSNGLDREASDVDINAHVHSEVIAARPDVLIGLAPHIAGTRENGVHACLPAILEWPITKLTSRLTPCHGPELASGQKPCGVGHDRRWSEC